MIVWEVIIWAVILLVVAVILIYVFKNSLGRTQGNIENQIDSTKDFDGDLVPDVFDRCCDTGNGNEVDAAGCAGSADELITCQLAKENKGKVGSIGIIPGSS